MKIDRRMNLVVPVERDDGSTVYVHSAPIGREVFERYFMVISQTFSVIMKSGIADVAGARVAALTLKKVAADQDVWEGEAGVKNGLMAEIRRLSNVVLPSDKGWRSIPLDEAIGADMFGEDDLAEVEGKTVFFIVLSSLVKGKKLIEAASWAFPSVFAARLESSSCSEFTASLPTSMPGANSGATAAASLVPS